VVESDDALTEQIVAVLNDTGYEVSTDYREGIKTVQEFDPDAVLPTSALPGPANFEGFGP
jgi:DNA-binding response OmpR family regulator